MKKAAIYLSILLLAAFLGACSKDSKKENTGAKAEQLSEKKLVIGVTAGPHEEILEEVAKEAKKEGLEIEPKVFTDYILPNTSLSDGDLDVNSYQHKPFLEQFNKDHKDHKADLVAVGATILSPMGVYSDKIKDLKDFPDKGKFGLPNDPTNGARALLILEAAGLIKLKEGVKDKATIHDIEENKKNIELIELDAGQIAKQLSELDAAAINTNYALEAGLTPKDDAIYVESSSESPYVNEIAVRAENKDDPAVKKLVKAYQSEPVKKFIEEKYKGAVLVGW